MSCESIPPLHQIAQEFLNLFQNVFGWWHFLEGVFITERLKHEEVESSSNLTRQAQFNPCIYFICQHTVADDKTLLQFKQILVISGISYPTWGAPVGVTGESSTPDARFFKRWALGPPNSLTKSFNGKSCRSFTLTNPRAWSLLAVWWPTPKNTWWDHNLIVRVAWYEWHGTKTHQRALNWNIFEQ